MARLTLGSLGLAAAALLPAPPALAQTTTGGGGDSGDAALGLLLVLLLFVLVFAAIVVGFVLIFRYVVRRNKERVAAMQAYAQARGLSFEGNGTLPPATPLLRRRGSALATVSGRLAEGLEGRLTNYRYSTGSKDNRRTYDFAVALAALPEAGSARLRCSRRSGGDLLDGIGDALTQYQTVELESAAFGESYRLMVRDEANMLAIRQLFSPSFIVLLTEEVPSGFWFELEGGYLMGAMAGEHWERPGELDGLCAATAAVAARIRADISERAGLRAAAAPPAPPRGTPPPPPPPPR